VGTSSARRQQQFDGGLPLAPKNSASNQVCRSVPLGAEALHAEVVHKAKLLERFDLLLSTQMHTKKREGERRTASRTCSGEALMSRSTISKKLPPSSPSLRVIL
jgi:hypothetical protein